MSDDPVAAWRAGHISAEVALARLLLRGLDAGARGADAPELRRLLAEHGDGIAAMRRMLARVDHHAPRDPAAIAAMFDRAAAVAPEASVAAYSLGDAAILSRATAELVSWLARLSMIGPWCDVLDFGCGIGRIAAALAPLCRSVLGTDVSRTMITLADARHSAANLRFVLTDGEAPEPGRYGLVLAVDSMPYLIQAGVAEAAMPGLARALRPGAVLGVLNLSYRGAEQDRTMARRWARDYRLNLLCCGSTPFTLWDGAAFLFRRVT